MELIPNWQTQDLTCEFCGTKKSVKYKTTMTVVDSITWEKYLRKKCVHVISVRSFTLNRR